MPRRNEKPLPFLKDLGGRQRVGRAAARRCWSLGLPVWQDAGRGAVKLAPPRAIPCDNTKQCFDSACLGAEAWVMERYPAFSNALRRRCVYLVPWGPMALHFTFKDRSNPFVKYGSFEELLPEIASWSVRYDLEPLPSGTASIAQFELAERHPAPCGPFSPMP